MSFITWLSTPIFKRGTAGGKQCIRRRRRPKSPRCGSRLRYRCAEWESASLRCVAFGVVWVNKWARSPEQLFHQPVRLRGSEINMYRSI